ncbi:hypothetical protein FQA39_LY00101 [Lamprigera yunnana]|nr:hypothetical protein FQA39_LY00101 [Lamprigera yunnana]
MAELSSLIKDVQFVLKIVEFILCLATSILLSYNSVKYCLYQGSEELVTVAADGYLLIIVIFIILYVIDSHDDTVEKAFLIAGAILNIVAGVLTVTKTKKAFLCGSSTNRDAFVTLTIICGVVMFVDFLLQVRK